MSNELTEQLALKWMGSVVFVVMALCFCTTSMGADQQTLVLREQIGRSWRNELISFALDAPFDEYDPKSLSVTGPDGPVAFQVNAGKLWLITDLAPLSEKRFIVRRSDDGTQFATTDLKWEHQDDVLEITTSNFGIRLPVGAHEFDTPVAASRVPAPIQGVRMPSGQWGGGSEWTGEPKFRSFTSKITDRGPCFVAVELIYQLHDAGRLKQTFQVHAGSNLASVTFGYEGPKTEHGWQYVVTDDVQTVAFLAQGEHGSKRAELAFTNTRAGKWLSIPIEKFKSGQTVASLVPFADGWNDMTTHRLRLKFTNQSRELWIKRWDAGAWVEPGPIGQLVGWQAWQSKMMPLARQSEQLVLKIPFRDGMRKWRIGWFDPLDETTWRSKWAGAGGGNILSEQPDLNKVLQYSLDWSGADQTEHPRLLMSASTFKERIAAEPKLAPTRKLVDALRHSLAEYGELDKLRRSSIILCLYDAVIDSELLSGDEKRLFRAQMAYLAYQCTDPSSWSIERGYRTYNFNMNVVHGLAPGLFAMLFPRHPMAQTWLDQSVERLQLWLKTYVGPNGEWPESNHYTQTTLSSMLFFAVAAKHAGRYDFFKDPDMRRLIEFIAQQYTPQDVLRRGRSVSSPVGRGSGGSLGLLGIVARATAADDPELSKAMQWHWQRTDYSATISNNVLGFQARIYLDRSLPAQTPRWPSRMFDRYGAVLRSGSGTDQEHYINFVADSRQNHDIWWPEQGRIARWFAWGTPISGAFNNGYSGRHELIGNGVMPARNRKLTDPTDPYGQKANVEQVDFASLPSHDYVTATYELTKPDRTAYRPGQLPDWPTVPAAENPLPMQWQRQLMFVKRSDPAESHYIVLRDTVSGGKPSMWQFWTLSHRIEDGQPPQQADIEELFGEKEKPTASPSAPLQTSLPKRPGSTILPPRPLRGDRFTAIGVAGVDLEYFVASPKDTPRHTLRWGSKFFMYDVGYFEEYQDLLHLQRPDDGAYMVVMYPRKKDGVAPQFSSHADGRIVRVQGQKYDDYTFLSDTSTTAEVDNVSFSGMAASVTVSNDRTILTLSAAGRVAYGEFSLAGSDGAVTLDIQSDHAVVRKADKQKSVTVTVKLPGQWQVAGQAKQKDGSFKVQMSASVDTIRLDAR